MNFVNETPARESSPITPDRIIQHLGDLSKQANEMPVNGSYSETTKQHSIIDELKKALIDPTIETVESPMIASIGHTPIATLGNFSCIIGKAKSKKTFLITIIVAAFLKGAIDFIQAHRSTGKSRIIWFDTEQSRNHVVRAYR